MARRLTGFVCFVLLAVFTTGPSARTQARRPHERQSTTRVNYFIGREPSKWRTAVPASVRRNENGSIVVSTAANPAMLVIDPYVTYLGGTGADTARAIAVDDTGAAYVAGTTTSASFP